MLNGVQDKRSVGILDEVDDALHAQELRTMRRAQQFKKQVDCRDRDRLILGDAEGAYACVVPIAVMRVRLAAMPASISVEMTAAVALGGMGDSPVGRLDGAALLG